HRKKGRTDVDYVFTTSRKRNAVVDVALDEARQVLAVIGYGLQRGVGGRSCQTRRQARAVRVLCHFSLFASSTATSSTCCMCEYPSGKLRMGDSSLYTWATCSSRVTPNGLSTGAGNVTACLRPSEAVTNTGATSSAGAAAFSTMASAYPSASNCASAHPAKRIASNVQP